MKIVIKIVFFLLLISFGLNVKKANAVVFNGTYTIGPSGNYTSIKNAATALNSGSVSGATIFELQTDYSSSAETYPITFNAISGASATNTITFRPASGVVSSFSLAASSTSNEGAIFIFNGTDYLSIDGRPGGSGTNKYLELRNSNSSNTGGPTISFKNDATYNTVRNCLVEGESVYEYGIINFGASSSAGNDYNTITYCKIGDLTTGGSTRMSRNLISTYGSSTSIASNNVTISYNEFYDGWSSVDNTSYIYLTGDHNNWTIDHNSFYRTAEYSSSYIANFIYFTNVDGGSLSITNNYFGGSLATCGGSAFSFKGLKLYMISFASNCTNNTTVDISNNTFSNCTFNNATGTMEAVLFEETSATGLTISGNQLSTLTWTSTGTDTKIFDITVDNAWSFSNNKIGSSTNNNITYADNSSLWGLYHGGASTCTSSSNKFQEIYHSNTGTASNFFGYEAYNATSGVLNSTNDSLIKIDVAGTPGFYGFYFSYVSGSVTQTITRAVVDQITCTASSGTAYMYPFYMYNQTSNTATLNVKKCKVTNIIMSGASANNYAYGIHVWANSASSGKVNLNAWNNVIILENTGYTSNDFYAAGIYIDAGTSSTNTSTVYHNTIKIGGSTSASDIIYCLRTTGNGISITARNNVFEMSRTTGSLSCAIYIDAAITKTFTNNSMNSPNETELIWCNGSYYTLATWDALGANIGDNDITQALTVDANGYVTTSSWTGQNAGYNISATVTDDLLGVARDATPWIGAYESASVPAYDFYWVGGSGNWDAYATHWATTSGGASFRSSAPTATDNVYFNASSGGGTITLNVAASASTVTFTNFSGSFAGASALSATTLSVTSGTYAMGVTTANFSGNATIAGTVTISTGTLDVDGTFNATGGTITFSGAGNLALGGATVTSLGTLSATAGTVKYNRAGAQTVLSDNYFNLTIDGSGTKTLGGTIDVDGSINITAGTLDVSASNYAITCASNWTNGATFVPQAGTVTFDGSGAQSITTGGTAAGKEFYNFTVNNSAASPGDATDVDADVIYIYNNLVVTDGQFQPATGSFFGPVEIQTNGILKPDANAEFTVSGAWLNTNGTFTHNNTSAVFGLAGTITTGGTGVGKKFYDVTLNGSWATLAGNIDIDRHFILSMGNWSTGASNYSMNIGGDFVIDNAAITSFNANSSTVTFDGSSTQYINVTTVSGTTPVDEDITFYDIVIDNTDVRFYYKKAAVKKYFNMRNITVNNGKTVKFLGI
ncbi:MAG: hypothetical protein WCK02_01865 [Bacteroidota bacterium]